MKLQKNPQSLSQVRPTPSSASLHLNNKRNKKRKERKAETIHHKANDIGRYEVSQDLP